MTGFRLVSEYPVRARRLFDLIRKPAFQEAQALALGTVEVQASIASRNGHLVRMRIERADRLRPHSDKTIRSVVHYDWDVDRMEGRWSQHHLDRQRQTEAEGLLRVEVRGRDACQLIDEGHIQVRVPLLGRKLEQRALARLESLLPRQREFIGRQLGL